MFSKDKPEYIGEYVSGGYRGQESDLNNWDFHMVKFTSKDITDRTEDNYKINDRWHKKEDIIFYDDYDPLNKIRKEKQKNYFNRYLTRMRPWVILR